MPTHFWLNMFLQNSLRQVPIFAYLQLFCIEFLKKLKATICFKKAIYV